jgi:hypothetical protein
MILQPCFMVRRYEMNLLVRTASFRSETPSPRGTPIPTPKGQSIAAQSTKKAGALGLRFNFRRKSSDPDAKPPDEAGQKGRSLFGVVKAALLLKGKAKGASSPKPPPAVTRQPSGLSLWPSVRKQDSLPVESRELLLESFFTRWESPLLMDDTGDISVIE